MGRYKGTRKFKNSVEYYEYLRKNRNLKSVSHYETPILRNPTVEDRTRIISMRHIWKSGDRFYKLADQNYGDSTYWWVIAWYNSVPTEAHLNAGDIILIPVNLQTALSVLGVNY
tara:strand:+ start:1395 stop:1736 length:342 start_codon:yes stop_codon:yes gene_type:complete